MTEAIRFYCGITEKVWNYFPVSPGKYGCVAPVFGSTEKTRQESRVYVPDDVSIIQDSGAFCDSINNRLSYQQALDRQRYHAEKYNYVNKMTHRVSYDLLIDEKWIDGKRTKQRWDTKDADYAVDETLRAAEFISNNRDGTNLVLSAQGVTKEQYIRCTKEIMPMMDINKDIFGMGGWCIIGRYKTAMIPMFDDILFDLIPMLGENKIKKVHIFGVVYAKALGHLLWMCDKYNIQLSTDSSGPQKRPAFGQWGYAEWRDKSYVRPPTSIRGQERAKHVQAVIGWLSDFRNTKWYEPPNKKEENND